MGGWLWDHFHCRRSDRPYPWLGRLVAFTDHRSSNLQPVDSTLLRVVLWCDGFIVVYTKPRVSIRNAKKPNLVTVVQAMGFCESTMLAGLNVGQSISIERSDCDGLRDHGGRRDRS
jgi:hypothetical protein